ncbi:hypothetical protein PoB_005626700 [Plakobranchus ocellatus]|uniref:Uncharacterized protein n=1 Tax=Plakobranchus ocellatus TaxID=259542 RepID=A0AAV4CEV6_9GAST|nr:hypothetical protein PoB_005626700 [Plakobranchus ocellatus]
MISGFQDLRRARAPLAGLEPAIEGPCRSQGGFAIHCATDASIYNKHQNYITSRKPSVVLSQASRDSKTNDRSRSRRDRADDQLGLSIRTNAKIPLN